MTFVPKRVFFEQEALKYSLGEELWQIFRMENIPLSIIDSHNRVTGIPGKTAQEAYLEAKQTLVIGVRRLQRFETCKPSAHFQLPLCTSCAGKCEYCYLNTTLGKKPYLRLYVNIDEILHKAAEYIQERAPELTTFEGAATSDPLPLEIYSGALARSIEFFGKEERGRFRFVTKFTEVDSLLSIEHHNHTRFRFSLNTASVIAKYEHATPDAAARLAAAVKVAEAGYPLGFIIAPVIIYVGWQEDYEKLLAQIAEVLPEKARRDLTFEIITHRFTARAKKNILDIFPKTTLPMTEDSRRYKYGQFGYGKYVYPQEDMSAVKEFFEKQLTQKFPGARLEYIV